MRLLRRRRAARGSRRGQRLPLKRLALQNLEKRCVLAAVAWANPNGGAWDVAGNWSTGVVPGPGDDVTIDTAAAATIAIRPGDSISVNSLTTGTNDTLSVSGGSLTVAAVSTLSGPLTMTGGSLTATGSGGSLTADGSTSIADASLYAEAGGTLSLPQLTSYASNATTLEANGSGSVLSLPALVTIVHDGSLSINADGGGEIDFSSLKSLAGSGNPEDLRLNDIGNSRIVDPNLTSLNFVYATLDGSDAQATGSWTKDTDGFLSLSGGSLSPTRLTDVDGTGLVAINGGRLALPAVTSYAAGPKLTYADGAGSVLDLSSVTTATNYWQIVVEDGAKLMLTGLQSMTNMAISDTGGSTVLDPNVTAISTVQVTVDGSDSQVANSWTSFTNGSLRITGGTYNLPRLADLDGSSLSLSGGALLTLPVFKTDVTNPGVSLTGHAQLSTTGDFTNAGTLSVDAGSKLSVGGNFTQTPSGSLNVQLGGLPASGQFGQVAVQNRATLAGVLNVATANGYVPQNNDDFPVMTFASATGNFATVRGLSGPLTENVRPMSVDLASPPPETIESPLGVTLNTSIGIEFYGSVASFRDSNPAAQSGEFAAVIDWGDGTTSGGNINANGGGFQVSGFHDYAHSGTFTVTTTVVRQGIATTIIGNALVLPAYNGRIGVTTSADTHAASAATSPEDANGNISLRSAVEYLNATGTSHDTISFDGNYVRDPIALTLGQIEIDASLTIDGGGVYQLAIEQAASGAAQLFQIDSLDANKSPVAVSISNLTINPGPLSPGNTAAITNLGGLTLNNVDFVAALAHAPAKGDTVALVGGGGQLIGAAQVNGMIVNPSEDAGLSDFGNLYPFKADYSADGLDLSFDTNPTIRADGSGSAAGDSILVDSSEPLPANDVVADWRFQEGAAGQSATGAILDSSGHGLSGTPINLPDYSPNVPFGAVPQTGQPDKVSLSFNGVNQRVFVADSPSLALTHSLTIDAFVYVTAAPQNYQGYILFRGDNRGGLDPYTLGINGAGSNLSANFNIDDASGKSAGLSAPLPGLNRWVEITGTLDDATGLMRLYINGIETANTVTSVRPFAALDPTELPGLGIGSTQAPNYGQFFPGLINEIRICDVALTPGQFLGSTSGNFLVTDNGKISLNEPASDLSTLTLDGAEGADTFDITPSSAVPITVHGSGPAPVSAPSGTLVLPQSGNLSQKFDANSGYSGAWSDSGVQAVTFDGIQTLEQKSQGLPTIVGEPNTNYVMAVYHDVLDRAPDASGLAYWTNLLDQGAAVSSVAQSIAHSDEYYANFVIKPDFLSLLGRAADDASVKYWTTQMEGGLTDQQLEAELVSSDEFFKAAGGTNAAWLDAVYKLLLGRPADADGTTYWLNQLSSGATLGGVAQKIAGGQENDTQLIKDDYFHYLGRAADDAGIAFWLAQFAAGKTNEDVIAGFTGSAEYYQKHTS